MQNKRFSPVRGTRKDLQECWDGRRLILDAINDLQMNLREDSEDKVELHTQTSPLAVVGAKVKLKLLSGGVEPPGAPGLTRG